MDPLADAVGAIDLLVNRGPHMSAGDDISMIDACPVIRFAKQVRDAAHVRGQFLLVARLPDKVSCWVITDCVCYDNWPVPAIARLQALHRLPLLPDLLTRAGLFQLTSL